MRNFCLLFCKSDLTRPHRQWRSVGSAHPHSGFRTPVCTEQFFSNLLDYIASDGTFETIYRSGPGRGLVEHYLDRATGDLLWTDVASSDPLFFDRIDDFTLYSAGLPTTAVGLTATKKKVATLTNDWNAWIGKVKLLPLIRANAGLVLYLSSPKEAIVLRRSDGKRWSFKAPTSPDPMKEEGFSRPVWIDEHEAVIGIGPLTGNLADLETLVRYPHPK